MRKFRGVFGALNDDGFELIRQWVSEEHQSSLLELLAAPAGLASASRNADVQGARVRRGEAYSEPTAEFLGALVALRVHFDRNDERTGALQLIRGSHLWGIMATRSVPANWVGERRADSRL